MPDASLVLESIGKRFRSGSERGLWQRLLSLTRRSRRASASSDQFWALREINLTARPGDAIGVIGPNGAGKSTLLKILAGILRPDEGLCRVRGRLAAMIELGAGFHGDLTGRENIFLNGAVLGMSRAEIARKLDAIVAFAGVDRFLDMPVKRYSSGMYARLGFAVASHIEPDVLLVDEVLSVGDAVFRVRCLDRMKTLLTEGATLVFVTHQLDQMQALCSRALVLDGGRCIFDGDARRAAQHYLSAMTHATAVRPTDVGEGQAGQATTIDDVDLDVLDADGSPAGWVRAGAIAQLRTRMSVRRCVSRAAVEFNLRGAGHDVIVSINSARSGREIRLAPGANEITLRVDGLPLAGGQYLWNVRVWDLGSGETLVDTPFRYPMLIDDGARSTGAVCVEHEWVLPAASPGHSLPATSALRHNVDRTERSRAVEQAFVESCT